MSTAKAQRMVLTQLGAGATVMVAVLMAVSPKPDWCDGEDAAGRAVYLVGRAGLGKGEQVEAAVDAVMAALRSGEVPEGVVAVAYAPMASACLVEVVGGASREVLADGPRGSGKTQAVPAALMMLAEAHARAGGALPLKVLWLHDSLTNASIKTGQSVEQAMWGGVWAVRDDRREVVCRVAGQEMVVGYFVGTQDDTSAERLRAECHVVAAEELVASLVEAGGIEERKYELGLTSRRLPTRRHVAVCTTNPGDMDSWPYRRFIEGGGQLGCVRCPIPSSDRMTMAQVETLEAAFRDSPDLARRLAKGEWSALTIGETVAVGFDSAFHVSPTPLIPAQGVPFVLGHDAGLTPVTVIGQWVNGEIRIYTAPASERAGTRQHLESVVLPWFAVSAPWALQAVSSLLVHYYDPAMDTPDQSNLESSPVGVLRQVMGGITYPGAMSWPGRRDPLLTVLNQRNRRTNRGTLQLDPGGCRQLIAALNGRWHYPVVNGSVSRELPNKNHPWSDLGDALAYFIGGVCPEQVRSTAPVTVESEFALTLGPGPRSL